MERVRESNLNIYFWRHVCLFFDSSVDSFQMNRVLGSKKHREMKVFPTVPYQDDVSLASN